MITACNFNSIVLINIVCVDLFFKLGKWYVGYWKAGVGYNWDVNALLTFCSVDFVNYAERCILFLFISSSLIFMWEPCPFQDILFDTERFVSCLILIDFHGK